MRITLLVLATATLASCTRSADLPGALVANDSEAVFDTVVDAPLSRRTFTFTNVGPNQTRPLQVELHGDRDLFAVDWDACSGLTLKQDGHCDVVVRLDGNAAGAFDGELRVFADTTLSASVLLHGKVAPASLVMTAISSSTVAVTQGQTAMLAFDVHNAGGATTGVIRVTPSALPFDNVTGDCDGATLAGGGSCTIKMSRAVAEDAAIGTTSGTLDVAATPGGDLGATPTLVVSPIAALAVSSFDFGAVPTLTPTTHALTVTNPGKDASGKLAVSVASNESYAPFSISFDGCSGMSLAAGASCTVTIAAELYDANAHSAMLVASAPNLKTGAGMLSASGVRAHWMLWINVAGNGSGTLTYGGSPIQVATGGIGYDIKNGQASQALAATADNGSTFAGWSGTSPCSGTGGCAGFIGADNSNVMVVATFNK